MSHATFKIWRTHADGDGTYQTFQTEISDGMVVLDAVHRIQAEQADRIRADSYEDGASLIVHWTGSLGSAAPR